MKPKVYVTRRLPEEAQEKLDNACDVEIWDKEYPPPYDEIQERIKGKVGLLCLLLTGLTRIW